MEKVTQAMQPDVSIIIAAYQAVGFIDTALASALAQSHASFEVIVAPDDDHDYRALAALDSRIRVLAPQAPSAPPSGPAATRNRALAAAGGQFVAVLDADDHWSPDYLARLLPLAKQHGLAFGRTIITDWDGRERRLIPHRSAHRPHLVETVDYADFAVAFGSLHALVRRDAGRRWHDHLAEDVLFDIESLALVGGTAPFAPEAHYYLRIRAQSLSHSQDFIAGIDAGYAEIIQRISQGGTLIPADQVAPAIGVFRSWQAMNARFGVAHAIDPDLEFHAFIAGIADQSAW